MIEITEDMYGIVRAIKFIDRKYRVFYDKKRNQYSLHYVTGFNMRKELVFPFDTLDRRAVWYVLKTQKKDVDALVRDIENQNKQTEERNKNKVLSDFSDKIRDSQRRKLW